MGASVLSEMDSHKVKHGAGSVVWSDGRQKAAGSAQKQR
jgi:hypothetical protein